MINLNFGQLSPKALSWIFIIGKLKSDQLCCHHQISQTRKKVTSPRKWHPSQLATESSWAAGMGPTGHQSGVCGPWDQRTRRTCLRSPFAESDGRRRQLCACGQRSSLLGAGPGRAGDAVATISFRLRPPYGTRAGGRAPLKPVCPGGMSLVFKPMRLPPATNTSPSDGRPASRNPLLPPPTPARPGRKPCVETRNEKEESTLTSLHTYM